MSKATTNCLLLNTFQHSGSLAITRNSSVPQ